MSSRTSSHLPKAELEGYDLRQVQRRFLALNEARLQRTRTVLGTRQRDVLALLPFLFHTNHELLPGYAGDDVPAGVEGYAPVKATLDAARRHARGFRDWPAPDGAALLGIYCMGSAGSVAFTADSDLDVWLCHDPALDPAALRRLEAKARRVEAWAAELDLEVHFFPVDVARFRAGAAVALSSESSGTAQQRLLLEEFYRTGILLAGRYPLWWLVPPERETEYGGIAATLRERDFMGLGEPLDFGALPEVPAQEFFGAALWQLSKGIDAPYKSLLKLILIEAYASEYPAMALLSRALKERVYGNPAGLEEYDPYRAMLHKVEGFLARGREERRLELVRRAFYLKTGVRLSDPHAEGDRRREVVAELVRDWGWSAADLALLDRRDEWGIPRLAEERNGLFEALTRSYRFLSGFARRVDGEAAISQRDLTVLGRKLYAAYERKADKLELINRGGIGRDMRDGRYTLQEVADKPGSSWCLYQGGHELGALARQQPFKRARSLVELVAWAWLNRVLDARSVVTVHPRGGDFAAIPLGGLLSHLEEHLPLTLLEQGGLEDFARPAKVVRGVAVLNMGLSEREAAALFRDDEGEAGDPLHHGAHGDNLVLSLDGVQLSSWKEAVHRRYLGPDGLFEYLCDYLKWWPLGHGERPVAPALTGLTGHRGIAIAQRVDALFDDLVAAFYGAEAAANPRYVIAAGAGFVLLSAREEGVVFERLADLAALIERLEQPQPGPSPVLFDRYTLEGSPLRLAYQEHRPGLVQLFYLPRGAEVEVYVIDERGSLFRQRRPYFAPGPLLNHYSGFFEAVLNRMRMLLQEGDELTPPEGLECFALERDEDDSLLLVPRPPGDGGDALRYMSLQALVDRDEAGRTVFTLYCDGREFSNLEYGKGLFRAVVDYVLERRESGETYPIYITDLSLSRSLLGEGGLRKVQTLHFFKYKQRTEEQLNRALERARGEE